jgi:hypothetical protein
MCAAAIRATRVYGECVRSDDPAYVWPRKVSCAVQLASETLLPLVVHAVSRNSRAVAAASGLIR